MTDAQRRVCKFVASHPPLMSALYDLDLMPLDLLPELVDARAWSRTVRIVALYAEAAGLEPPWMPSATEPVRALCGGAHVPLDEPPRAVAAAEALSPMSDHIRDADADLGAGAVYVMPEPPQIGEAALRGPDASPLHRRTILACAVQAERIEREALGSPIAQDTARRIRLAILALR